MLLASYELMFASYFIVSRRKHTNLRTGIRQSLFQAGGVISLRKKFVSDEPKDAKPVVTKKSRF